MLCNQPCTGAAEIKETKGTNHQQHLSLRMKWQSRLKVVLAKVNLAKDGTGQYRTVRIDGSCTRVSARETSAEDPDLHQAA